MILLYTPTSPYSRIVRIVARRRGVDLDERYAHPFDEPPLLLEVNPLGTVPALRTDQGDLVGSRRIARHLGATPSSEEDARLEELAQGLLDFALDVRWERTRPETERSPSFLARREAQIRRTLEALSPSGGDLGDLTLAVALAYVRFRLPDLALPSRLAAWLDEREREPAFRETAFPSE